MKEVFEENLDGENYDRILPTYFIEMRLQGKAQMGNKFDRKLLRGKLAVTYRAMNFGNLLFQLIGMITIAYY